MKLRLAVLFLALGAATLGNASPKPARAGSVGSKICSNLMSSTPIDPGFSDLEKSLACGSASGAADLKPEWRNIPDAQREFHIRTFLQARGYLNPKFEVREGTLWVDPGPKRLVAAIHLEGAPTEPGASFDYSRKRRLLGQPLTPGLLNDVKNWTRERLRGLGYACPKIDLTGDPDTGVISVRLQPGPRDILAGIVETDVPGLMPGIFRRYDAFDVGAWFNGDALTLTENRVLNDGQVQGYKLIVDHCEDGRAYVKQNVIAGKPRLLTLGAGADTEGVLIGTAEWKNTRLGNTASTLDFQLAASTKSQIFTATGNWYFLDWPSRIYLKPVVSTDHENKSPYETITEQITPTIQTSLDTSGTGFQFGFGPCYDIINNLRGSGASFTHFLFLQTTLRTASHYFDYYLTSPRSGFLASLTANLNDRSALSDMNAQQLQLNIEALWNYNEYSPPLVVFGIRGSGAVTFTDTGDAYHALIPPPFRQYIGGSSNLRGFGLLELPKDQVGRLTSFTSSIEIRLCNVLPLWMQPFTFVDVGALGTTSFDLDPPLYWSPGAGLRVQSPIGVFRGTIAHGYLAGNPDQEASHFQLFLSYGEEF